MAIHYDIRDHELFGPAIRQGREEGLAEGLAKGEKAGEARGKREEALSLLQRQIEARFGPLSNSTKRRLAKLTLAELEDLSIGVLSAKSVRDLFGCG